MKRVTIQEIAEELGLSRNTVSKALTDSEAVAAETKDIVIKKAIEMGYPTYKIVIPESMSQIVVPENKKKILILTRRETANFWNRMVLGISDVVNEHQDTMQLHVVNPDDENDKYIPPEFAEDIDGIIIMSVFKQDFIDRLARLELPMVFFDAPFYSEKYLQYGDVILPEGVNATRIMTNNLIKQGLKRISFIGDVSYCRSIIDRFTGFCQATAENNITNDESILFTDHVKDRYFVKEEVERCIDSYKYTPDAIVCSNDDIAVFVYSILKEKGLNIPKDIAVTGFDNIDTAEILSPTLTTATVHSQTIGRRLALQLYNRIRYPHSPSEMVMISSDVVTRESSKRRKLFS